MVQAKKKSGGDALPPKPKPQQASGSGFHFDFATGANAIAVAGADEEDGALDDAAESSDDEESANAVQGDDAVDFLAREHGIYMYWSVRALERRNKDERRRKDDTCPQYQPIVRRADGKLLTRMERRRVRRRERDRSTGGVARAEEVAELGYAPAPAGGGGGSRRKAGERSRSPTTGGKEAQYITSFSLDVQEEGGGGGDTAEETGREVLSLSDYEEDGLMVGMFPHLADAEGVGEGRGVASDAESSSSSRLRSTSPVRGRGRSPDGVPPQRPAVAPAGGGRAAAAKGEKLTPAERLKRKMAMALNKTIQNDKKTTEAKEELVRNEKKQVSASRIDNGQYESSWLGAKVWQMRGKR